MARGNRVELETIEFDNKSLALAFFKAMLNEYIPGDRVSDTDAPHLNALFKRHADYESKVGCGIDHFGVMPGDYGTQCFCVIRKDGTKEGFSYIRCVNQSRS